MISIYGGTTPNTPQTTFYYITGNTWFQGLRSQLSSQLIATLTPDTYTMSTNMIRITNGNTPLKYRNACYVMDDTTGICYFVDNIRIRSGYTELDLSVDLWGTYSSDMSIANAFLLQTNKKLKLTDTSVDGYNGVYSPIKATENTPEYIEYALQSSTFAATDVVAVFQVLESAKVATSPISTDTLLTAAICGIAIDGTNVTLDNVGDIIGRITGRVVSGSNDIEITVGKAWLVPRYFVSQGASVTFRGTDWLNNTITATGFRVNNAIIERPASLVNINPNYDYFFGTKYNRMQLPRRVDQVDFTVTGITTDDGFKLLVTCGANILDLSNDFELGVTKVGETNDAQSNITKAIGTLGNLTAGAALIAAAPATGGTSALAGVSQLLNGVNGFFAPPNTSYSAGVGVHALYMTNETGRTAQSPLVLSAYKSLADETRRAGMFGVEYNEAYRHTFLYLFSFTNVVSGSYDTFAKIQCDVNGVPKHAAEYIQSVLASGNRFIAIATT